MRPKPTAFLVARLDRQFVAHSRDLLRERHRFFGGLAAAQWSAVS
jgi:hypothetical protein